MMGSNRPSHGLAICLLLAGADQARAQPGDDADQVVVENTYNLQESTFQQWIFGVGARTTTGREQFDLYLRLAVADVDRACSLTDPQRRKLFLAGRGDAKRFLDRIAEARKVFDRLRRDPNGTNEILQETQPLAAALTEGLHGEGSFFAKTLETTLTPEQSSRYREALRERVRFRYRGKVLLALANLDPIVGFSSEQQARFVELILQETTPPAKPGGQFEANVVLFKIARLPESKVRPILDDVQWKMLNRQLEGARGLELFLRLQGQLDESDGPRPAPPVGQIEGSGR